MSDLIDRQAVLDTIHRFFTEEVDKIPTKKTEEGEVIIIHKCQPLFEMNKAICKRIKALPSAEKTGHNTCYKMCDRWKPKTGHWNCGDDMFEYAICSSCKHETGEAWEYAKRNFKYCPNCGCRMVEPQESEEMNGKNKF